MFRQLLRKELRLQKSNAMFTFGVVLLWGLMLLVSPRANERVPGFSTTYGDMISLLGGSVVVGILVIVLPVMIGAVAVAEERKIEVLDWHFSLPVSRRKQWTAKVLVAVL